MLLAMQIAALCIRILPEKFQNNQNSTKSGTAPLLSSRCATVPMNKYVHMKTTPGVVLEALEPPALILTQ